MSGGGSMLRAVITWVVTAAAMFYVMRQVKKPGRLIGRGFLASMNVSHSDLTDWGLTHVTIAPGATILDVGCGGGRTVQKLAAAASAGKVFGVDYAAASVDASRATNRREVEAGRVEIRAASVSKLPFPDATFDLVTAVETHYYWPDLPSDLREVLRVVKPGGAAIVIAECYPGGHNFRAQQIAMLPLRAHHLSAGQLRDWFAGAGFAAVQVSERKDEGWVCVTGRKPAA